MVWRAVGCGIVGGLAVASFMMFMLERTGAAPVVLLPLFAAPLAWWGARRAPSLKHGALLGFITIGTPVSAIIITEVMLARAWGAPFEWEAIWAFGPTLLVGTIVGTITGGYNE